ncbi:unnamed protein product [Allacma fusca]|uniref:BACK domain-containing protein n=1 Tax=Allacma fusca TaxID=39272 RepID=A0A8J2KQ72_9HEXA|nr:unnamed protein product [Allacma fusca]
MDSTEGHVTEINRANIPDIGQGNREYPKSEPASIKLFGFSVDVQELNTVGRLENPLALVREIKSRGMATTENVDDRRGYILKNAASILRRDKFLELSSEELLDFLRADDLAVDSELDVYKALLRWGVHNLKKKSEQITTENMHLVLVTLFPVVRFYNMTKSEIRNYVLPLNLLLPEHTQCLKDWCNGKPEDHLLYSNVQRIYSNADDDGRGNETYWKRKLERAEAEAFLAEYDRECIKYNSNLEILEIRRQMVKAIEEKNYTRIEESKNREELTRTTENLNQTMKALHVYCTLGISTKRFVCTVKLTNNTSVQLSDPYKYFRNDSTREYCEMPAEIPPNTSRSFGFEREKYVIFGLFSYCIHRRKDVALTKDLTKDLNLTLELENLKAEASMITGEKALLSIVLSEKLDAKSPVTPKASLDYRKNVVKTIAKPIQIVCYSALSGTQIKSQFQTLGLTRKLLHMPRGSSEDTQTIIFRVKIKMSITVLHEYT